MTDTVHNSLFDWNQLPDDLLHYILKYIATILDKPTLTRLIKTNRDIYDTCCPALYETIELDKDSVRLVFYGLDYTVEDKTEWGKVQGNELKNCVLSLASHQRKLKNLNHIKNLIVTDFESAEYLVRSLHPDFPAYIDQLKAEPATTASSENEEQTPQSQSDSPPIPIPSSSPLILQNLTHISLGLDFVTSDEFYPHCGHESSYTPHPIITLLSHKLSPSKVCYDFKAAKKFHENDPGLSECLWLLLDGWGRVEQVDIHNVNAHPRPCDHIAPKYRVWVTDMGGCEDRCDDMMEMVGWYIDGRNWCCAHERNGEESVVEIICSGDGLYKSGPEEMIEEIVERSMRKMREDWEGLDSGVNSRDECLEAAERRWRERRESGWFERYLRCWGVEEAEEADVCGCCGRK
ncbi:hypothetical protein I302_100106 [Kwoniella bestiolae CBS 10118]|uniref:F-box domain-containing protein n=1 Tax=Kwoniella bestiolae CBS 10118 TaxID=1296100 RepID=A0A1B9G427_9TREE|nr:hypothetical protein I302_03480 [Kwoniella bestiolae CBS 10118]OCF25807.1 hypothetical protein I302_03480 [Kwoniella bestiolae CBS 10118]